MSAPPVASKYIYGAQDGDPVDLMDEWGLPGFDSDEIAYEIEHHVKTQLQAFVFSLGFTPYAFGGKDGALRWVGHVYGKSRNMVLELHLHDLLKEPYVGDARDWEACLKASIKLLQDKLDAIKETAR